MTRLKILKLLMHKELCVCELVEIIGISQPGISQHLRKLKAVGFIRERKDSQWIYYSGDEEAMEGFLSAFGGFLTKDLRSITDMEDEVARLEKVTEGAILSSCKPK